MQNSLDEKCTEYNWTSNSVKLRTTDMLTVIAAVTKHSLL